MIKKSCIVNVIFAVIVVALVSAPMAWAAEPSQGTVTKRQDVTWTGGPFLAPNPAACVNELDPTCDHFLLYVDAKFGTRVAVGITTADPSADDYDLFVYDSQGTLLASSATATGTESLVFEHTGNSPYEVRVQPWLVSPGSTYEGAAMTTRDEIDEVRECLQPAPESTSLDFTQPITLEVRVLLDGLTKARGKQIMNKAAESYAPLNVHIKSSYRLQTFDTNNADEIIQAAKDLYGGERPNGIDIVYVITTKDIESGGNDAVAGLADCIGGVRFPDTAFAVGEDFGEETDGGRELGPFVHTTNGTAVVAAHEIGHLMGAHHHYGNCVEGFSLGDLQNVCSAEPGSAELTPCTLMFNAVNFASLPFSTLNKSVARGYAEDFASP